TFKIGGDTPVVRLGYGAMRITGPGIWGPPRGPDEAIRVLRRAVDLGVNFIDTADSYGPYVSEELIPQGAPPLPERPCHCDQGRFRAAGPRRVGPRRPPPVPAPGGRDEPSVTGRGATRPVPAPPHRPPGATR